jgi:dihydrofolate reductase
MAKLIYAAMTSLDGYIEDTDGKFHWAKPDEEVHAFANALERGVGTHLYGRRLYEVMSYWQSVDPAGDEHPVMRDYAEIWQATDKVVFSRTLKSASTPRTRIEPEFDVEAVREMKAGSERDISIGGAALAAVAIKAGLVDEYHLLMSPVLVGGGKPALPDGVHAALELVDTRRFGNGVVHVHYRAEA